MVNHCQPLEVLMSVFRVGHNIKSQSVYLGDSGIPFNNILFMWSCILSWNTLVI